MHARWDSDSSDLSQSTPEYVTTSIGRVEIGNMANRLRDMAALLAAHGLDEAADYLVKACGSLLAQGSHSGSNGHSASNGHNGTNGHGKTAVPVNGSTPH